MSMGVFQPVGQKRLTNIAVVRYKKYGKRFEIACYKNKVKDWRNEIEHDIDEVLQTVEVFSNVSKALLANDEDLKQVFGSTDRLKVCREILEKGEMQVSEKERKQEMDVVFKDVAKVLSNMCIDPNTNRPYTHTTLERALHDIHFKVDPKRPAKLQALEALKLLQEQFSITRASLGLIVYFNENDEKEVRQILSQFEAEVTRQYPQANQVVIQCSIQPGNYRPLSNQMQQIGNVKLEIDPTASRHETAGAAAVSNSVTSTSTIQTASTSRIVQNSAKQPSNSDQQNLQNQVEGANVQAQSVTKSADEVVYSKGPICNIPDEMSNRKEMFLELDNIEQGWEVELVKNGDKTEAVFYSPNGEKVGAFVRARRQALTNKKAKESG
eukprot:TRINITY_DN5645_c0_g4_i2.p1 TRINITY_DN5645_c0_g4~~TRINITY_DN5645_c0_g4_i2.p1  ORF type:complete len:382 (-),score=35.42 TRINITY_DN5645_c0_g4_i2:469-1614(-)